MYLIFTPMSDESYHRQLWSLLLYLCDILFAVFVWCLCCCVCVTSFLLCLCDILVVVFVWCLCCCVCVTSLLLCLCDVFVAVFVWHLWSTPCVLIPHSCSRIVLLRQSSMGIWAPVTTPRKHQPFALHLVGLPMRSLHSNMHVCKWSAGVDGWVQAEMVLNKGNTVCCDAHMPILPCLILWSHNNI